MERLREKRAALGARKAAKLAIYNELLIASANIMRAYASLRAIGDATSKWLHAWHQLTKASPAQPTMMDIVGLLHKPMGQLMDAWSRALLIFDQDEIDAVNKLVQSAQKFDLLIAADATNSMEVLIGAARREFAEFARIKLGESAARVGLP